MAIVTIYGASDDLIEIDSSEKTPGADEYNSDDATFILIGEAGDQVRIRVWFAKNGCWMVGASPVDEDIPMLPLSIEQGPKGYTAVATIEKVRSIAQVVSLPE